MKPIPKSRKPRSLFRLDPSSCALPPKKFLSLTQNLFQPPSSFIAIPDFNPHSSSPTKHAGPLPISCRTIDPIENP